MKLSLYKLTRHGRTALEYLCPAHVAARRELGWTVEDSEPGFAPAPPCVDCGTARDTVLAATIAAADARGPSEEPEPVRVLPGQRSLFADGAAIRRFREAKRRS